MRGISTFLFRANPGLKSVPRFFIDTDDGRMAIVDEDGHDLVDEQAARDLAVRALSDMTRDAGGTRDRYVLSARVRAEDGSTLYSATLALAGEWWIARTPS